MKNTTSFISGCIAFAGVSSASDCDTWSREAGEIPRWVGGFRAPLWWRV